MQGASWDEAVLLIRAFNSNEDDRQRPCGWTKSTTTWRQLKETATAGDEPRIAAATQTASGAGSEVTLATVPESTAAASSGVTPAVATGQPDDAVSGVIPATTGTAADTGGGTAVADAVEGSAFSVIVSVTDLRSSQGAQKAFHDAADRMNKIASTPSQIGLWGEVEDDEEQKDDSGLEEGPEGQPTAIPPSVSSADDQVTYGAAGSGATSTEIPKAGPHWLNLVLPSFQLQSEDQRKLSLQFLR